MEPTPGRALDLTWQLPTSRKRILPPFCSNETLLAFIAVLQRHIGIIVFVRERMGWSCGLSSLQNKKWL
jgi:hypothetical protein